MRVVRGHDGLAGADRGGLIAIGNFDGVHRGHQAMLAQAGEQAAARGLALSAAVFDPHPRRHFAPDAAPWRLMGDARRAAGLAALGVARLHILPFGVEMAAMTPEVFARTVLTEGLGAQAVAVGADFRFGRGRAGDADTLAALGRELGFDVIATDLETAAGGEKVSSSAIRARLAEGDVTGAAALLGRPWIVDGVVAEGDRRGRTLGFPTANIGLEDYVRPRFGVYAVTLGIGDEAPARPGVANIGRRPTVDGTAERLEVHLFDFSGDLYSKPVSVAFHAFLRDERRFDGLDALKAQIAADADAARALLAANASVIR